MNEIARCPNPECKHPDSLEVVEYQAVSTGHVFYRVECKCGYNGPDGSPQSGAIRLHNLISAAPDDGKQAGTSVTELAAKYPNLAEYLQQFERTNATVEEQACEIGNAVCDYFVRVGGEVVGADVYKVIAPILAGRWHPRAPDDGKGQPESERVRDEIFTLLGRCDIEDEDGNHECRWCHDYVEAGSNEGFRHERDCPYEVLMRAAGLFKSAPQGWQQGAELTAIEWQAIWDAMAFTANNAGLVSDAHNRAVDKVEAIITRHQEGKASP